jgi:peptidoglycan/LPS O-acetylase OafA/YrhL
LDVLRGVAIVLVLVRHMPEGAASSGAAAFFYQIGWTGVDLFFVLSGYLISGLLYGEADATGKIRVGRFWLRRGLKIWPSYFACYGGWVLSKLTADLATGGGAKIAARLKAALPNLIFIQNYVGRDGAWPHSWSLAIEEHFYLALPLLFLAAYALSKRRPLAVLPYAAGAVCLAAFCLRLWAYWGGARDWESFYYPTHMRADALAFGVLLGYAHRYQREKFRAVGRAWPWLLALSVPLIATAAVFPLTDSPFSYLAGFTLLYLAYGGLVAAAGTHPNFGSRLTVTRALAWLGVYSYTIYLAHSVVRRLLFVSVFTERLVRGNVWADRVMFWTLSIAGGVALSHAVERPFLRLRSRLFPSRGEAAAPARVEFHVEPPAAVGQAAQAG